VEGLHVGRPSATATATAAGGDEDIEMIALEAGSTKSDKTGLPRPVPSSRTAAATAATASSKQPGPGTVRDVAVAKPLSSVAHFRDACLPVGVCRAHALAVLSNIFESYYGAEDAGQEGVGRPAEVVPAAEGASEAPLPAGGPGGPAPSAGQVMLGPALDALADWILRPPVAYEPDDAAGPDDGGDGTVDEDSGPPPQQPQQPQQPPQRPAGKAAARPPESRGLLGMFFGALAHAGGSLLSGDVAGAAKSVGLGGASDDDGDNDPRGGGGGDDTRSPIDYCCGVLLHVFVSAPQDLPPGGHASVPPLADGRADAYDPGWVDGTAAFFAAKSLAVHLWAVTSFEGHTVRPFHAPRPTLHASHLLLNPLSSVPDTSRPRPPFPVTRAGRAGRAGPAGPPHRRCPAPPRAGRVPQGRARAPGGCPHPRPHPAGGSVATPQPRHS